MKKTEHLYALFLSAMIIFFTWLLVSSVYLSATNPELTQMQVMYTVLGIGGY